MRKLLNKENEIKNKYLINEGQANERLITKLDASNLKKVFSKHNGVIPHEYSWNKASSKNAISIIKWALRIKSYCFGNFQCCNFCGARATWEHHLDCTVERKMKKEMNEIQDDMRGWIPAQGFKISQLISHPELLTFSPLQQTITEKVAIILKGVNKQIFGNP